MFFKTAAVSGSITSSSLYASRSQVESQSSNTNIAALKPCLEKELDRRRIVKGASEECYALGAMFPSVLWLAIFLDPVENVYLQDKEKKFSVSSYVAGCGDVLGFPVLQLFVKNHL